jgi:hypothetical protein
VKSKTRRRFTQMNADGENLTETWRHGKGRREIAGIATAFFR